MSLKEAAVCAEEMLRHMNLSLSALDVTLMADTLKKNREDYGSWLVRYPKSQHYATWRLKVVALFGQEMKLRALARVLK